jgi:copper chaperone
MKQVFKIGGMTCQGCVNAVTKALKRLDPAAAVSVDLTSGRVSVEGAIERAAAERAIETAGFVFEGSAG